jgi:OFA family oxalate/formate antiporter-like MFS transporter
MKNRWVVLSAGIVIQTILGGIYAWSTFVPALTSVYKFTKGQCGFIFGLTIAVFTLAMTLAGWVLNKKGPAFTAFTGSVLYMTGYFLASYGQGDYFYLLIGLGVLAGAGIGFGYVCPLSTGMKWFPEKKGFITGIAVAGFGFGAVLFSSLGEYLLLSGLDVLEIFRLIALVFGTLLMVSSLLLKNPDSKEQTLAQPVSMGLVFTLPFAVLFIGIFAGTFSGLLVIGNLTPIVVNAGLTEKTAALAVAIFAAGNALGRIFWGFAFDRISFKSIPASLAFSSVFLLIFIFPVPLWAVYAAAGLLGFGFGANFVIYAASCSKKFGIRAFSRLYPVCFLGYGIAGLTGPGTGGMIADVSGSYINAIYISTAITVTAFFISLLGLKYFDENK